MKAEGGIINSVTSTKFSRTLSPRHLFDVIPKTKRTYITRNHDKLPYFKITHDYFKISLCPSTVIEWNKMDLNTRNYEGLTSFEGNILKFIHPSEKNVLLCNNPKGIQLLGIQIDK